MALVIFFVPDPARGVAEMKRVVRPGGMVAAYAWDILGGGFALEPIRIELRAMGLKPVDPPSVDASRLEVMRGLWSGAGLEAVETREISVQRTFSNFEEFWDITVSGAPSLLPTRGRCRVPKLSCSKREFARAFQAMPQDVLLTDHARTR
jgi:hypothetical protein